MDFLEENKDVIERAIYFRVADVVSLDECDRGIALNDAVCGSEPAGKQTYSALARQVQ